MFSLLTYYSSSTNSSHVAFRYLSLPLFITCSNRGIWEQFNCKHCQIRLKIRLRYEVLLRNLSFLGNAFPLKVRVYFFWLFSPDYGALSMMLDNCKPLILLIYEKKKWRSRTHVSYSLKCPFPSQRPSTHTRKPSITYYASYLSTIWKQSCTASVAIRLLLMY